MRVGRIVGIVGIIGAAAFMTKLYGESVDMSEVSDNIQVLPSLNLSPLSVDIKLVNPTESSIKMSHPTIAVYLDNGNTFVKVAISVPSNEKHNILPNSQTTINIAIDKDSIDWMTIGKGIANGYPQSVSYRFVVNDKIVKTGNEKL